MTIRIIFFLILLMIYHYFEMIIRLIHSKFNAKYIFSKKYLAFVISLAILLAFITEFDQMLTQIITYMFIGVIYILTYYFRLKK